MKRPAVLPRGRANPLWDLIFILVSVGLHTLSFPKPGWWVLAFVALGPFFMVLGQGGTLLRQVCRGLAWGAALAWGMGYWVFPTLYQYYEVPFFRSLFFFCLCLMAPVALLYGLFAAAWHLLAKDRWWFRVLIVSSLWVLTEYVKEIVPVLVPWGSLAVAVTPFAVFVQAADLVGAHGLLFLVVVVNALILEAFMPHPGLFPLKRTAALALCLMAVGGPCVYGAFRIQAMDAWIARHGSEAVKALLVQGDFSNKDRWSGMGFASRIQRYLELSSPGGFDGRVTVWPETVLNAAREVNDDFFARVMGVIGPGGLLVSGGVKTHPDTGAVYNCVYFIAGDGRLTRYDKHLLLPYAETAPFGDVLGAYYTAPSRFGKGRTPLTVDTFAGRAGVSVCMEMLYGGFIRRSVRAGAGYLVNVSNDSWFGDSPMPHVHLMAARLRAVETRRFVLRASNSGISAVITPTGEVSAASGLFTQARVEGRFIPRLDMTLHARCGDFTVFCLLLLTFFAFFRKYAGDKG